MRRIPLASLALLFLAAEFRVAIVGEAPPLAKTPFNAEQAKELQQRWQACEPGSRSH